MLEGDRAYLGTFGADVLAVVTKNAQGGVDVPRPRTRVPALLPRPRSPPAVIIGGRDKAVHGIDAASGKSAWKFVTKARVDSSPVVAGSRVYVGSSDGRLYVLDAASGPEAVGVSRPATRSPPRPRSPPVESWSDRPTAACTASDKIDQPRRHEDTKPTNFYELSGPCNLRGEPDCE